MILSHNKSLYDKLFLEIARINDEVAYRKHLNAYKGQKGNRRAYPAVSVGADLDGWISIGHHHSISREQDFHPLVLQELLNRLGELNKHSINYPACKNQVGHCAENYAASSILKTFDPNGHFNNDRVLSAIKFTKAFHPRTWKNIDWCANCHTMFD